MAWPDFPGQRLLPQSPLPLTTGHNFRREGGESYQFPSPRTPSLRLAGPTPIATSSFSDCLPPTPGGPSPPIPFLQSGLLQRAAVEFHLGEKSAACVDWRRSDEFLLVGGIINLTLYLMFPLSAREASFQSLVRLLRVSREPGFCHFPSPSPPPPGGLRKDPHRLKKRQ